MTAPTGAAHIRDIVAVIVARAVQPFRGQVFRARTYPLKLAAFPAVLVYGYEEIHSFVTQDASPSQATAVCQMVVQVLVCEASPEAAEVALELVIGAVRTAVLQSHMLLGDCGQIERILSVKTTRQIKAESDDVLGEAHIVFEMQWSEVYHLVEEEIDLLSLIVTMFCQPILRIDIPLAAPDPIPDPDCCGPIPPADPCLQD